MAITLTEAAAERVTSYIDNRGSGVGLRLGIKKTGCSGFAYVVDYADEVGPDDVVFRSRGVKVVIDPIAKAAPTAIDKSEIALRTKLTSSIMPEGLLNKLSREEILDLIAYVHSAGDKKHKLFEAEHHH